tara:strand:+ start:908 stop:1465 length:558 start_codon:yes stop_codon:yes gene_type:complete
MIVVDNYIKDKSLQEALKSNEFWQSVGRLNWWDGWWKTDPKNICEQFIKIVWTQFSNLENKIAGFEYWSNAHQTGGGLNWHVDKDEKLMREKKELVMPSMGLVYYAISEELDGGYLEIANSPDRENVNPSKIERLKPIENRLIIFNPSYPHRVSQINSGKRRAIIVNAWPKKPYTFEESKTYSRN